MHSGVGSSRGSGHKYKTNSVPKEMSLFLQLTRVQRLKGCKHKQSSPSSDHKQPRAPRPKVEEIRHTRDMVLHRQSLEARYRTTV